MPTPFSSQDLGRIFDARALTRGRTLGLSGGVEVELEGDTINGIVQDRAFTYTVSITPSLLGRRVVFDLHCTCRVPGCAHLAAAAFGALDRFPVLRRPEQQTFLDTLTAAPPEKERQRIVFELAPGDHPYACVVTTVLIGERTGIATPTTPAAIAADDGAAPAARDLAYLLGEGTEPRTGVRGSAAVDVLDALVESGLARWHAGGKRLVKGDTRVFASASAAALPPRSGVIVADSGPWYVDAVTGAVGRVRIQAPVRGSAVCCATGRRLAPVAKRRVEAPSVSEQMIVDRPMVPVLRLTRFPCPDEFGRMQTLDALLLEFDYDGGVVAFDDDRQFVRVDGPGGPVFVRRDKAAETAACDTLARGRAGADADGDGGRRRRAGWCGCSADGMRPRPGRDSSPNGCRRCRRWGGGTRSTRISGLGWWRASVVATCGWRMRPLGHPRVSFSLDFGIEIDGARHPLLPILMRLRERGGMASARVIDGEVVTSLEDGRILKLPADRIARLLAVMDDLVEAAGRSVGETMVLDGAAAPSVLDLEDLVTTRWQDGAMIIEQVARYRAVSEIPEAVVPARFDRGAAAVSATGGELAAASAGERAGRIAGGRYGAGEDGADDRLDRD